MFFVNHLNLWGENMRLIKKLICAIMSLLLIIVFIVSGGYVFVRLKYKVDLFSTISELKTLNEKVDEDTIARMLFQS